VWLQGCQHERLMYTRQLQQLVSCMIGVHCAAMDKLLGSAVSHAAAAASCAVGLRRPLYPSAAARLPLSRCCRMRGRARGCLAAGQHAPACLLQRREAWGMPPQAAKPAAACSSTAACSQLQP
jgi:hypothetical protein